MQLHLGNKAEKTLLLTTECENRALGQGISHMQDEEQEGERRSWRELQLPVSIAMQCRAGAQRGRGSARGWNGERNGKEAILRGSRGRAALRQVSAVRIKDGREVHEWREDLLQSLRCGRDVEVRHGSPRLATGDCHPQGHLESAQERPPCQESLHGGSLRVLHFNSKPKADWSMLMNKHNEAVL